MKKLMLLLGVAISMGSAIAQQAYNVRSPYDPATQKMAEELQGAPRQFVRVSIFEIYWQFNIG